MTFATMTKAQLGAYAAERGVDLKRSMTKAQMIAALETSPAFEPVAHRLEQAVADAIALVSITIHTSPMQPVIVAVNGRVLTLDTGAPVTIPAFLLPILDQAGVGYERNHP
jgi:hypothetical protein